MRQRTASSMNFERSPFFMPRAPREVRRVRSVSLETLMFQRTASLISSMQHLYTQTDKHLCRYCSTGGWPRREGMGRPSSLASVEQRRDTCRASGAPRSYMPRTQRSRAGLTYVAPTALEETQILPSHPSAYALG